MKPFSIVLPLLLAAPPALASGAWANWIDYLETECDNTNGTFWCEWWDAEVEQLVRVETLERKTRCGERLVNADLVGTWTDANGIPASDLTEEPCLDARYAGDDLGVTFSWDAGSVWEIDTTSGRPSVEASPQALLVWSSDQCVNVRLWISGETYDELSATAHEVDDFVFRVQEDIEGADPRREERGFGQFARHPVPQPERIYQKTVDGDCNRLFERDGYWTLYNDVTSHLPQLDAPIRFVEE